MSDAEKAEESTKIDDVAEKLCHIVNLIKHKENLAEDAMGCVLIRAFQFWVNTYAPPELISESIRSAGEMLILSAAVNKTGEVQ